MIGTFGSSTGTTARILLNSTDATNTSNAIFEMANKTGVKIGNSTSGYGILISKGTLVYGRQTSDGSQYDLHFYKIASS